MVTDRSDPQAAPGDLEQVRTLVNSWLIPNDTRLPSDLFDEYAQPFRLVDVEERDLRSLRDDLRKLIENSENAESRFARWLTHLKVRPILRDGEVQFQARSGRSGEITVYVLNAMKDRQWLRLKSCPDCRWVFYDHSRNSSKRWCMMNADGPQSRGCGTIAKVRRYREREKRSSESSVDISPVTGNLSEY
jgi:CGNR zinc finger